MNIPLAIIVHGGAWYIPPDAMGGAQSGLSS